METADNRITVELSLHQLMMELNHLLLVKGSFEASDTMMLRDCQEKLNTLLSEN